MDNNYQMFNNHNIGSSIFGTSIIDDKVIKTLTRLYELTDWRCIILQDDQIDREYNNMSTISMFKALLLPYIINISGERTLTKYIISEPSLQTLCGFYSEFLPRERTFWHFRNKYKNIYFLLLIKLLISLNLSGKEQGYDLPFVKIVDDSGKITDNYLYEISLGPFHPKVFIRHESKGNILYSRAEYKTWMKEWGDRFKLCENNQEYFKLYEEFEIDLRKFRKKHSAGFLQELPFPVDVTTFFHGKQIRFQIISPSWFGEGPLVKFSSSIFSEKYNKACNVIITRKNKGRKEILLSRRKKKGYGRGEYAIPGGKQEENESLKKCAIRELKEETNLIVIKSRPVSIFNNPKPNDPSQIVLTVGVLVEKWEGELNTAEIDRHIKWEWHDIENIPEPLFEPTKIAITQYIDNTYPNLKWEDFEKQEDQLDLL